MSVSEEKEYSLIADIALLAEDSVLLVKYSDLEAFDGQTGWFLPDASINYLEHPDTAAKRLLNEQLTLNSIEPILDHIESFRGNDGSWHLAFHYKAVLDSKPEVTPAQSVGSAQWFQIGSLPAKDDVAHHGWALTVLKKMQPKE